MPFKTKATSPTTRRRAPGHIDSYEEGRVCSVAGCTTLLSRYNGASICSAHDADGKTRA